ncbi:MAG: hypothetical protein JWN98_874 [Abditibacteriota bacterium]|jgi:hypothetical protein|nr:hypothetical protein [Abditibacteriota bacterium]
MRFSTPVLTGATTPSQVAKIKPGPTMETITPTSSAAILTPPSVETIAEGGLQKASSVVRSTRRSRKQQARLAASRSAVIKTSTYTDTSADTSVDENAEKLVALDGAADCSAYRDCLEQAEICREQARAAARLKRFKAARGLFATAINLCQRALGLKTHEPSPSADHTDEAQEYLRQLTMEMSTYSELAKSMERPLSGNASPSIHEAAVAALSTMPLASNSPSFSNPSLTPSPRIKPTGC